MLPSILQVFVAFLIGILIWKRKLLIAILVTAPRDITALRRSVKWQLYLFRARRNNLTIPRIFDSIAKKAPSKVCLYFEDEAWSFEQVEKISNRVANYFYSQKGLRKGDTVAVFMENAPEYVFVTLGLSKIGVISSLVNSNLRLEPLKHFLEVVPCKGVIFKPDMYSALEDVKGIGGLSDTPLYCYCQEGCRSNVINLHLEINKNNVSDTLPKYSECTGVNDRVYYMGTSGTTGLPKAVIFSHMKFYAMAWGLKCMIDIDSERDIVYVCLPLYHSTGFAVGIGGLLCSGIPLVLRKKFSATNFWKDCCKYRVTAAPYIGEVCRYLMATPPSPYDRKHKVRLLVGAGLRSEIWQSFKERFNIPMINEFYGSTEGNCNLLNSDGETGAVGYIPRIVESVFPACLLKVDEETMEPLRDPSTGLCMQCGVNEPGEIIGKIDPRNAAKNFEGYTDKASTNSKILRDVFKKGDSYFRSGDLLVKDVYGYFYFKDRQGDTFRWKAENVSTFEVESVITRVIGLQDVAVYGVTISGYDGKAGMAAIADMDNTLELNKIAAAVSASLPSYARPIFLRVSNSLETTGSFKMKKNVLKKEGLIYPHPEDKIYILRNNKYEPLTEDIYQQVLSGRMRL